MSYAMSITRIVLSSPDKGRLQHGGEAYPAAPRSAYPFQLPSRKGPAMMDISGKTATVTGAAPGIGGDGRSCPRPYKNDSAGHRGARLIHAVAHCRIKDSSRPLSRFYYCVQTATPSVFTQPGPFAAICHRAQASDENRTFRP